MLDSSEQEGGLLPDATCRAPEIPPSSETAGRSRRQLAEEVAVALCFNGSTHAVMMATPAELEDFGIGFAITEGVVGDVGEIAGIEVVAMPPLGWEVRMWVGEEAAGRLASRRRRLAGPVGCGLCGLESLEETMRPARPIGGAGPGIRSADIARALAALEAGQHLNRQTHAAHAAALWHPRNGLLALREDVGRHNALDKLVGAAARAGLATQEALVLVTSRVSVDLVQKAAVLGAPVLVAVSAPTGLAVRSAEACGLTLVAVARGDGFEVFSHPQRIADA